MFKLIHVNNFIRKHIYRLKQPNINVIHLSNNLDLSKIHTLSQIELIQLFTINPDVVQFLIDNLTSFIHSYRQLAAYSLLQLSQDYNSRQHIISCSFFQNLQFFIDENCDNSRLITNLFVVASTILSHEAEHLDVYFDLVNRHFISFLSFTPELINPYFYFLMNTARTCQQLNQANQNQLINLFFYLGKLMNEGTKTNVSNHFLMLKTVSLLLKNGQSFFIGNIPLLNQILSKQRGPQLKETTIVVLQLIELINWTDLSELIQGLNFLDINKEQLTFQLFYRIAETCSENINNTPSSQLLLQSFQKLLIASNFNKTLKLHIHEIDEFDKNVFLQLLQTNLLLDTSFL